MPMIKVKYDDEKLSDEQIVTLSKALQKIVIDATEIPEVFVYADSPKIKIDVAPVEVFVEMSSSKVKDKDELFNKIKDGVIAWKKESNFDYPITITLTPVDWKFEVGL
jgi:hypothetical protein